MSDDDFTTKSSVQADNDYLRHAVHEAAKAVARYSWELPRTPREDKMLSALTALLEVVQELAKPRIGE